MPAPLPSWGSGAVRFDPDLDSDIDRDLLLERRGMTLLMKDTWQPCTDLESELQARRALFEKWATADQAFRDSYLDRVRAIGRYGDPAPRTLLDQTPFKRFVCVAEVDKDLHPENYKRLLKILILCYMSRHLAPPPYKLGHAFQKWYRDDSHLPTFLQIPDQTTLDYSLSSIFLDNADWRAIHTTRTGTVYFSGYMWYIIDQESLDTGRVKVVDFKCDGAVEAQAFICPFNIWKFRSVADGLCWPLSELLEGSRLMPYYNTPLDLDIPLPDLLHGLKPEMGRHQHLFWGDREFFQKEIEDVAPGYLELEARGGEVEYNLDRLLKLGK